MLNQFRYHAGQFQIPFYEVKFEGSEVLDFLQNQSTFDIDKVAGNSFQLISFLDPQGRVEAYGWLLKSDKDFSFLIPKLLKDQTIIRLNKFLISEDVTISDPEEKTYLVVIGPEAHNHTYNSFKGKIFDEEAFLELGNPKGNLHTVSSEDVDLWRGLTGEPSFDGSDYAHTIINNLRLFDLSVMMNKGCYPGQETVSKIATRRGAAYSPVLLEVPERINGGEVLSFDKKIGTAHKTYHWNGKYYLACDLLRDFRVEKMKVHFTLNGKEYDGYVQYYPLIHGDRHTKAEELFYEAADLFRDYKLDQAEEKFNTAIRIDPTYADAYESLGVMLGRQERFDEAIELMQDLSKVDPKSVLAHTNMSLYLMRLGRIEEAEEQKSQATIKSFQKFGDEAKAKEVAETQKKKAESEWAQREGMFQQVLEIDPEDTLANFGLGNIAVEKGEWEKAISHLEKVIKEDPKYSVAYLALGKAFKGLGKKEEARKIWTEGVKVSAQKGDLMPANQMQQELSFLS